MCIENISGEGRTKEKGTKSPSQIPTILTTSSTSPPTQVPQSPTRLNHKHVHISKKIASRTHAQRGRRASQKPTNKKERSECGMFITVWSARRTAEHNSARKALPQRKGWAWAGGVLSTEVTARSYRLRRGPWNYYISHQSNVFDKRAANACEPRTQYPFLGFQGKYNTTT